MVFENAMVTHDVNIIAVSVRKNCSFQSQFEGNLSFQLSEIKMTPTILQEEREKKRQGKNVGRKRNMMMIIICILVITIDLLSIFFQFNCSNHTYQAIQTETAMGSRRINKTTC